jgi:hypothetical protein
MASHELIKTALDALRMDSLPGERKQLNQQLRNFHPDKVKPATTDDKGESLSASAVKTAQNGINTAFALAREAGDSLKKMGLYDEKGKLNAEGEAYNASPTASTEEASQEEAAKKDAEAKADSGFNHTADTAPAPDGEEAEIEIDEDGAEQAANPEAQAPPQAAGKKNKDKKENKDALQIQLMEEIAELAQPRADAAKKAMYDSAAALYQKLKDEYGDKEVEKVEQDVEKKEENAAAQEGIDPNPVRAVMTALKEGGEKGFDRIKSLFERTPEPTPEAKNDADGIELQTPGEPAGGLTDQQADQIPEGTKQKQADQVVEGVAEKKAEIAPDGLKQESVIEIDMTPMSNSPLTSPNPEATLFDTIENCKALEKAEESASSVTPDADLEQRQAPTAPTP